MYKQVNSPLLYYGGKKWLVDTVIPLIPDDVDTIVSPFVGGGSIELNLGLHGYRVKCYDIYKPLVNFWKCFLSDATHLIATADAILRKTNKETLIEYDRLSLLNKLGMEGAVWYYIYNHLSFNGCTASLKSFIRDYLVRENDDVIVFVDPHNRVVFSNRYTWENLPKINMTVDTSDVETTLLNNPNSFLYLDPPYPDNEQAYGEGDMGFDHKKLFDMISDREQWLLSYNDNEITNELYKDHNKIKIKRNTRYNKYEYLFFSDDLADIINNDLEQMRLF